MCRILSVKIDSSLDGCRIDYVLKKQLKISDALMTQLKKETDGITLNGVHAQVITKVSEDDILSVNIKSKDAQNVIPADIPIDILWEDDDILIVNKQGDMAVHPSRAHINDTLSNAVMYYLNSRKIIHIITRLDRETSGVVLIAKNPWMASLLSDEIKSGRIRKEYLAIVNGTPSPFKQTISAPIKRKADGKMLRFVAEDGKEAVTNYELINNNDKLSLVKLFPITGRTHQLRVHMSYIGHPIYGDSMYGAEQSGERTRLHCHKITFTHPITSKEISVIAAIPKDFDELL